MNRNWSLKKIGDMATIVGGGTPSTKIKDFWSDDIPWITPKDLADQNKKYISKGKKSISELGLNNSSAKLLPKDSVLFSSRAPIGYLAINKTPLSTNQGFKSLVLKKGYSSEFFYYLLKNNVDFIKSVSSGSTFQEISGSAIKNIKLSVPQLNEQNVIATILKTIDDKIENNKRINKNIEQFNRLLFKFFYINTDKNFEKLLNDNQDLSNNDIIKNLKNIIPEKFETKKLDKVFDFLEGPGIRNWQYTNNSDGIKFINIRCIKDGDLKLDDASKIEKKEANEKYKHFQLKEDDIIVSTSGTLGKFAYVRKRHLPLNLNTSVIRFRPIKNISTLSFLDGFVQNQLQRELLLRSSGSVQSNFGPTHLKKIEIQIPDFTSLSEFEKLINPYFEKRKNNLDQNDILESIKDILISKLVSGKHKIKDINNFLL